MDFFKIHMSENRYQFVNTANAKNGLPHFYYLIYFESQTEIYLQCVLKVTCTKM